MVNKLGILLLFFVISSAAFSQIRLCDNGLAKEVKLHADGSIKSEGYYKNGVKAGKWTYYYDSGAKESVRYYNSSGAATGKWTYWYEDGTKWNTVSYNKGELDGHWTYWYRNGNKWHQLSYSDGEVHGKWTFWQEDGSLNDSGRYDPDTTDKG